MLFKLIYKYKRGPLCSACLLNFASVSFVLINRKNALTMYPSSFDQNVLVMNHL